MAKISSYVNYLPPFLWSQENDPSQFLGRMLCVFEKILTGIPDGVPIAHITHEDNGSEKNIHEHDDFEKTIDELYQMFNPWHTDFLPWLASWVALTLQEDWSEYQKRKLVSEMSSIYQERGLKKSLHTYLDIYAAARARPRIAIDDGDAILGTTFLDNDTAVLHTIAHCIAISNKEENEENLVMTALLHPSAIAVDNDNNYIVADQGNASLSPPQQPSLWKVSSTGEIEYKSIPNIPIPMPHPIHSGNPLVNPTAVVVDKNNRYVVLDAGSIEVPNSAIYRFDPNIKTIIDNSAPPSFPAVHPVDMILDNSGNFVVLDRGKRPTGEFPGSLEENRGQKIVVVSEGPPPNPVINPLTKVIEPTALVMNSMGCFIVADAKKQSTSVSADLLMVDPNTGWSEIPLLSEIEENPLIFPTGLAFEDPQTLLVCDTGVRSELIKDEDGVTDRSYRAIAEHAAIYRIKNLPLTPPSSGLPQTQPTITRVTYERKLVNPTKIMIDQNGRLVITDKGEYQRDIAGFPQREWRTKANEFGITVLFSSKRPTSVDDRKKIRREIANVINEQKPGHISWWMKF